MFLEIVIAAVVLTVAIMHYSRSLKKDFDKLGEKEEPQREEDE